ncbi:unnamed protein product [Bursaphelenchus xylophilus]|uniref:(pine wood nematode) hypothetical protein n=1 Tax=Bursaphelenchus xylophilus TaxID=6326 RepID=A0A1I7SMV2_BURXY|nr:unnamed protein product [Bursaphelenchus xylophilus]CAG9130399.1 unnamed protein product [Bursaphelenchus xylophilus]
MSSAALVVFLFGLLGMAFFLVGLCFALLQIMFPTSLDFAFIAIGLGLILLAMLFWLNLIPTWFRFWSKRRKFHIRKGQLALIGVLDVTKMEKGEKDKQIHQDATETLMKSIRGIPYLIQAIQYSLETNLMTEMGQSVIGTSVIHTAPGCTSVLDCCGEADRMVHASSMSSRISGPDEQWQNTDASKWTNQQLKLSLNQRESSLTVFPYSESQPLPDSTEESGELHVYSDDQGFHGSAQSSLSRVTVSYNSANQHEIRCIGMTSAFLSKFNNSFKT